MANIVIKDLADSVELDRAAMAAITGGSRISRGPGRSGAASRSVARSDRVVNFPHFGSGTAPAADASTQRTTLRK